MVDNFLKMDVLFGYGVLVLAVLFVGQVQPNVWDGPVSHMSQSRAVCRDVESVCASLMKVGDHVQHEDGEYCTCEGCDNAMWDENDERTFTWYHHEKKHWLVQYRFCEAIRSKQCRAGGSEVAAVIRTDFGTWRPRIKKLYCRCPDRKHYLQGWSASEDKYWDYHYICQRTECANIDPKDSSPVACVKRYMDATGNKITGYQFQCTCAEGFSCPTTFENDDIPDIEGEDHKGPFVNGYCVRNGSKQTKPKQSRPSK